MKKLFVMIALMLSSSIYAQNNKNNIYPEVGKTCPDFLLPNISYFGQKQATLKDFKGKWLILDFWGIHCGSCINSFPKINSEAKEFEGKIQFIMVGVDNQKTGSPVYAAFREKEKLQMPCAFGPLLSKKWDIAGLPYIIVLDDRSIVRAIVSSLKSEDIKNLLANKPIINPEKAYREHETHTDKFSIDNSKQSLLAPGNDKNDTDFLYRSVLTQWKYGMPGHTDNMNEVLLKMYHRFAVFMVSAKDLYFFAYKGKPWQNLASYIENPEYGKFSIIPSLEMADSTLFQYENDTTKKIRFCYSLAMPPNKCSIQNFQEAMQRELKNYFGYDVSIETKKRPCWNLIIISNDTKDKLKTKGGISHRSGGRIGFTATNISVDELISKFTFSERLADKTIPFFNETGIQGNIDISFDASTLMNNFNDMRKALRKNGLDFIKGEKEMKVLVIRDPKPEVSVNHEN